MRLRRIRFLILFFMGVGLQIAHAENPDSLKPSVGFSISSTYGFLIAHRDALLPLQQEHLISVESSVFFTTNGKNPWERSFLCPEKGLHVSWLRPGSRDRLGNAIAVFPYLDFP
ncbi:MAG: hypothetical protein ACKO1U_10900, partial [Bacteroidota bacterium]